MIQLQQYNSTELFSYFSHPSYVWQNNNIYDITQETYYPYVIPNTKLTTDIQDFILSNNYDWQNDDSAHK